LYANSFGSDIVWNELTERAGDAHSCSESSCFDPIPLSVPAMYLNTEQFS